MEIAALDAETDPFLHGRVPLPFLWGITRENGDHVQFTETEDMIDYIKSKCLTIYAHNGGKFDFHFLKKFVSDFDDIMVINGRIAKMKIGFSELRDSYLLIPYALDKYKKTEIDYSIMEAEERIKPHNWKTISDYLKDDCDFLLELVQKFQADYGKHLTLATSSFKLFHKKFLKRKIQYSTELFYNEFNKFYYGGRVECFRKGRIREPFEVYDINSAYPYAMLHDHPWGFDYDVYRNLPKCEDTLRKSFAIITAESKGALPFRNDNGGLSFPHTTTPLQFFATGHEILAGLETNTIKIHDVHEVYTWVDTITFTDYINHFYDMKNAAKASGDKANYLFAKLFMNSLYGKFAANPNKYKSYMIMPSDCLEAGYEDGYEICGEFDHRFIMQRPLLDNEKNFYNVATAASVTGFVRAYLFKAIHATKKPFYCDTDSIAGIDINVPLGDKLGQWDCEGQFHEAAICGKKLYAFVNKVTGEKKIASKGVKLSASELFRVANGQKVLYKNIAPTFSVSRSTKFVERIVQLT